MTLDLKHNPYTLITPILISIYALAMGLMTMLTIPIGDDVCYSDLYHDYIYQGAPFPGFHLWTDFFLYHMETLNGRLGDKFMPLYMCLSPVAKGCVVAIFMFITMLYASRLAIGRGVMRSRGSIAVASCLILLLPWYDAGLLGCMFINYEASFTLCLVWLWYFISPVSITTARGVALFLLSVVAGSWHEAFSAPLFLWSVLTYLLMRNFRTRHTGLMLAGLAAGITFTLACPGFWNRYNMEFGGSIFLWHEFAVGMAVPAAGLVIAATTLCRQYILRRHTGYTHPQLALMLACLITSVCTTIIITKTNTHHLRAWWLANGLSVIVTVMTLRHLRLPKRLSLCLVAVAAAAAVTNLVSSIWQQSRIYRETMRIIPEYLASPTGTVYRDKLNNRDVSLLALRKVQQDIYVLPPFYRRHPVKGTSLHILPCELRTIDSLNLNSVTGGDGQEFFMTPGGHLLLHDTRTPGYATLRYRDENGRIRLLRVICSKVPSARYSDMLYVNPQPHMWEKCGDLSHAETLW